MSTVGRKILDSLIFCILYLRLDLIFVRMSIYENKIHARKKPALRYIYIYI